MNQTNDTFDADLHSGIAAYDAKNFSFAYQLLAPLANNNNPEALWRVAMMQSYGLGMIQNQALGVETFEKAVEYGSAMAAHMLGVAYMNGEGVTKDLDKAIAYFTTAVEGGLQGAAFSLSMIYSDMLGDAKKAAYWIDIADNMED